MACVVESLVQILQQYSDRFHEIKESKLLQKAIVLRDAYDENYSLLFRNGENEDLEICIRDAAYEAQDLFIDVDHEDYHFKFDLAQVLSKFDSIPGEILRRLPVNDGTTSFGMSEKNFRSRKPYLVGFDTYIDQLHSRIISFSRKQLEIIPIVGRAGSGKTTLAQQVFEHGAKITYFDVCVWVTISRPFELRTAMLDIVHSFPRMVGRDMDEESTHTLGMFIYKFLYSRRYMIILDNVWNYAAWGMLGMYFPDNDNYSRIMLTSRNESVMTNLKSCYPLEITPIDGDASFKLLKQLVSEGLNFPPELEDIGRKIAHNCAGLPLAIEIIANVLSRTERTTNSWELVEKRQLYFMIEESWIPEDQLLDALALSPLLSTLASPTSTSSTSTVVGFDIAISQLIHQLTSTEPELQVIPIVGVGGSGKTTLARQLYCHSLVTDSFKIRAWITISESFDLRACLLGLYDCFMTHNKLHTGINDEALGQNVYQILKHKKYFIVVDDIWNASAWEELKRFFPKNQNGSRIILTTRKRSWGEYAKSSSGLHEMQSIGENDSWDLIVRKVFGGHDEYIPPELEEIGRKIARNCRGLPLAVAAAAGILSKSNRTVNAWNNVESCKFYSTEDKEIQDDSSLKVAADSFSKDGRRLSTLVTETQKKLQVIPIIGSGGGSGKTTLARLLYYRAMQSKRFGNTHAWVTCSQHKEVAPLLQDLLGSLSRNKNEESCVIDDKDLAEHVHKALINNRYLIVLDDIKDKNNWDMLMRYFEDDNNGSRIILTAREWTSDEHYNKNSFKMDSYMEFLIQRAFEQDSGLSEMEELRAREFWELVWQDKRKCESDGDLHSDLLVMTYNHLPYRLKPCFLYMGVLPEDYEIKASKIINLWIAEGFVEPQQDRDLEDIAQQYLMDLISRNILSVCRRDHNGKVAAVKIHDVFWHFCTKKAIDENFVWFKDLDGRNFTESEDKVRRVSVNSLSEDTDLTGLDSVHSFLCFGRVSQGTDPTFLNLTLLRVLDVLQFEFVDFPEEMLELVNLRYLAFTCHADIPSSITKLRYLLFLIIANALSLPSELWHMGQLRHIKCKETWEWGSCIDFINEDLQSLSYVPASLICKLYDDDEDAYNIRKLGIFFRPEEKNTDYDLSILNKVEKLKCTSSDRSLKTSNHLSFLTFPVALKKLTLKYCNIPCGVMNNIGALPWLEQLILRHSDFESDPTEPNWEPVAGEFLKLCILKMEGLNLERWGADSANFPELQHLSIRGCHSMKEIPRDIGHTRSLQLIEVDSSSLGVVESALQIKKEIEEIGNNFLEVVVHETH